MKKARLQLDVSEPAKRNLQLYAVMSGKSMSALVDKMLTRDIVELAARDIGADQAVVFKPAKVAGNG